MNKEIIQLQMYFQTADDVELGNPVTAHYIRAYTINKAMELYKTAQQQGKDVTEIRTNLEKWFAETEKKKQFIPQEKLADKEKNKKDFLNFVLLLFKACDDEYREETYDNQTAMNFHLCGMLFDAYSIFGELDEDTKNKRKYAKAKAIEIKKNLAAGFIPKSKDTPPDEISDPLADIKKSTGPSYQSGGYPTSQGGMNQGLNQSTPNFQGQQLGGNTFQGQSQSTVKPTFQQQQQPHHDDENLFDPKPRNPYTSQPTNHSSSFNPYPGSQGTSTFPTSNQPTISTSTHPTSNQPTYPTSNQPTYPTSTQPTTTFPTTTIQPTSNTLTQPTSQQPIQGSKSAVARRDPEFYKKVQDAKLLLQKGISELDYKRVPQAIDNIKSALELLEKMNA